MPSSHTLAVCLLVVAAGCAALPGPAGDPTVVAENRAPVDHELTVTAVHTGTPVPDIPVELRYEDGTVERTVFGEYAPGDGPSPGFFIPEDVVGFRVVDRVTDRWSVSLGPGERARTTFVAAHPGDAVLVEWRRADGTVTRVKAVGCRSGLARVETRVTDRSGGGGGSVSC